MTRRSNGWSTRDEQETLIFLHLPKTAGMTLTGILRRQYPRGAIYKVEGDLTATQRTFKEYPEEVRARFRLIAGQLSFGIHTHVPGRSTYITLLRDPVERVLSTYYYVLRHEGHVKHERVAGAGLTLAQVLEQGAIPMLDNGQTRGLSGLNHLKEIPYGACTPDLLERVKGNLDAHFAAVGLAEMFDESLVWMQKRFGWQRVFYRRHNVTPNRPDRSTLSAETLELIQQYNRLDLALYEWARARLVRSLGGLGDAFAAEVRRFRRLNRAVNAYWRVKARVA